MSAQGNASIVTSGLVLNLDSANPKSTGFYNHLERTEEFENAYWGKLNSTVTANTTIAPDGTSTADKLVETTTNSQHFTYVQRSGTNETLTFSVYAKAAERGFVAVQLTNNTSSSAQAWFNLTTGTIGTSNVAGSDYRNYSANIENTGSGWYRCSITTTKLAVNTDNIPSIYVTNADGVGSYTGTAGSGIYIWGAQLTETANQLPYQKVVTRPTTISNLIKTNPQITGTLTNGAVIRTGNKGSMFFDGVNDYVDSIVQPFSIQENTPFSVSCVFKASNLTGGLVGNWNAQVTGGWRLSLENNAKLRIYLLNNGGGAGRAIESTIPYNNVLVNCTATYSGNSSSTGLKLYVNGIQIATTTVLDTSPGTLTNSKIVVGAFQNTNSILGFLNGKIYSTQLYNRELTASEILQNYNATKSRYI